MIFKKNERRRLPLCVALAVGGLATLGLCSLKRKGQELCSAVSCKMKSDQSQPIRVGKGRSLFYIFLFIPKRESSITSFISLVTVSHSRLNSSALTLNAPFPRIIYYSTRSDVTTLT